MKNKTVLITGAGGFIGSHLTERLVKEAKGVKAFVHYNSRNDYGLLNNLPEDLLENIDIVFSDVTDPEAVYKAIKGVDIIFHLAALIGIPYSYYAPNAYVQTNINGTLNVLNAAREHGCQKIVHTSTSEVYGTAIYTPIDEKHSLQGQSPYSASKIGADKLAESYYLSFNVPVTTIRPFNTFGPGQSLRAVIPTIITQMLSQNTIQLGNTTTIRDFNYVKDTVNGFILMANSSNNNGEVVNIGSGNAVTIKETAELIGKILDKEIIIESHEERLRPDKSEVYTLICNATKAEELLGWKSMYSFEDGLRETIEWFKRNYHRCKSSKYVV